MTISINYKIQKEILFFLCLFVFVIFFQYSDIFGITNQSKNDSISNLNTNTQSTSNSSQFYDMKEIKNNTTIDNVNLISVDIVADRKEYTEFEDIAIFVKVYGKRSELIKLVLETKDASNTLVHKSSQVVNTSDYKFYLHPGKLGLYNVTVKAIQGSNYEIASTTFNVVSIFTTNILKFIYLSLGFFSALLILITIGIKNHLIEEILRFVFLSGIVASLLASLLFTDLQFGTNSPIGLIKTAQNEWVFNIGNALTIPLYVIVFGLIGGYIRYLYKTSKLIEEEQNKIRVTQSASKDLGSQLIDKNYENIDNSPTQPKTKNSNSTITPEDKRRNVFFESLRDIALFFLSPLLAIAVYFLLVVFGLSGTNSIYTIAVVSFSIGLVTEDVIQTLIRFTQEKLSNNKKNENQSKTNKLNDNEKNNEKNKTSNTNETKDKNE